MLKKKRKHYSFCSACKLGTKMKISSSSSAYSAYCSSEFNFISRLLRKVLGVSI